MPLYVQSTRPTFVLARFVVVPVGMALSVEHARARFCCCCCCSAVLVCMAVEHKPRPCTCASLLFVVMALSVEHKARFLYLRVVHVC